MEFVLCVTNRHFRIVIGDKEFFDFLQNCKERDFQSECIDEKELLAAYIKKSSELFEKEKKIKQLLARLEVDLS